MLRVPGLDEDEVTMAVAAARGLLQMGSADPTTGLDVVLGSRTATGWSSTFAEALGILPNRLREASAEEVDSLLGSSPAKSAVPRLIILADAARPGSRALEEDGLSSQALGVLTGAGPAKVPAKESEPPAVLLTSDRYQSFAKWDREAPLQVPRGAYVPETTWAHSKAARYGLRAGRCPNGHTSFPPRSACPRCGKKTESVALPSRGALETFTVIAKGGGPSEFDALQETHGDYAVGVATFGQTRMPAMICDTPIERLRIGLPVEPVFRRLFAQEGMWRYGLKLREVAHG